MVETEETLAKDENDSANVKRVVLDFTSVAFVDSVGCKIIHQVRHFPFLFVLI